VVCLNLVTVHDDGRSKYCLYDVSFVNVQNVRVTGHENIHPDFRGNFVGQAMCIRVPIHVAMWEVMRVKLKI
jgi:hypothetical protein